MKAIILILLAFSAQSWAKSKDNSHQSLSDLLQEIRYPAFTSKQRQEILGFSLKIMKSKLSQETNLPKEKLTSSFMTHAQYSAHLIKEPWFDLQTQFYTTLHQENYHQRWLALQKLVVFSDYGKNINQSIMFHWSEYSPAIEGRFYSRWNKVSVKKDGRVQSYKIPYFLMSDKIQELISIESHVPFEEIFPIKSEDSLHTDSASFLKNTSQLSRIQKQELAEKMELNHRIFLRAVSNGAKTIASIHFLTGESRRYATEEIVKNYLNAYCKGCSIQVKKEMQLAAMTYVDSQREFITHENPSDVVSDLCNTLKKSKYFWNAENSGPTPLEVLIDLNKMPFYITFHSLAEKNMNLLSEMVTQNDMGLLILTKSMSLQNRQGIPIGTKLGCIAATKNRDISNLKGGITEAHQYVETYIKRITDLVIKARYKLTETNSTLEYFVQTNQSATTEAISTFPQGIGWTLKALAELDQDITRRKKTDTVVAWGGTIVGVGLTISGFFAPEGMALILATAGFVKNLSSGTYYMIRISQEKAFFREMQTSRNSGTGLNNTNFKKNYLEYKSLKVTYLKEFTQSATSYIRLYKTAITVAGGNVGRASSLIRKLIKLSGALGQDAAEDKLHETIVDLATKD